MIYKWPVIVPLNLIFSRIFLCSVKLFQALKAVPQFSNYPFQKKNYGFRSTKDDAEI